MTSTRTGVSVFTWGTTDHTGYDQGMIEVIQSGVMGENVGHASLLLTMPDTPATHALLEKYLKNTKIPYETKKYFTKQAEVLPDGSVQISSKNAYEESVVEVYFSWWPSFMSFHFNTFVQDSNEERMAKPVHYDPEWEKYFEPTITRTEPKVPLPSFLMKKEITLSAISTVHLGGATEEEKAVLLSYQQVLLSYQQGLVSQEGSEERDYNLAKSLVKLNGVKDKAKYEMTVDDKKIYQHIKHLKRLEIELFNFDSEHSDETKKMRIKKLLFDSPLIKNKYPEGIDINNHQEILDTIRDELSEYKDDSYIKKNKAVLVKLSMSKLYSIIEKIENAKNLQIKLNEYEHLPEHQKAQANIELSAMISTINELKSYVPFDENNLSSLQTSLNSLLDPENGSYFKKFSVLFDSNNRIRLFQGEATLAMMHRMHTQGHPPDNVVTLPLKNGEQEGIDPEEMLKQMNHFATSKDRFRLIDNNCSVTASEILAKGAKDRGWLFEQKAMGQSIVTPQVVYQNAVQYSSTLRNPELTPPVVGYYTQSQNKLSQIAASNFAQAVHGNAGLTSKSANTLVGIAALSIAATLASSKMAANFVANRMPLANQEKGSSPQPASGNRKKSLQFYPQEKKELTVPASHFPESEKPSLAINKNKNR